MCALLYFGGRGAFHGVCSMTTQLSFIEKHKVSYIRYIIYIFKSYLKTFVSSYHHIISFLDLKIFLTLEKYTKFDSQGKMKSANILGKCWTFQSRLMGHVNGCRTMKMETIHKGQAARSPVTWWLSDPLKTLLGLCSCLFHLKGIKKYFKLYMGH